METKELIAQIPIEHQAEVWKELNQQMSEMDAEMHTIDNLVMRESKIRDKFRDTFLRLKFEEYVRIERDKEAQNSVVKAYDEKVKELQDQVDGLKRQIK